MLAAIAEGHADLADVLFLVAVICFVIVAVLHAMTHNIAGVILAAGLAAAALAWLVF